VKALEQDKRRSQRLLLLARKSMRSPVSRGLRGRPPKRVLRGPNLSGRPGWRRLKAKASPSGPSTQTRDGENAP
jgi:hypothetical protein